MSEVYNDFNIRTPHAAMIIWNYIDRINVEGVKSKVPWSDEFMVNATEKMIVNTLHIISLETQKTKSDPQGSFSVVLAPTKNWIAAITPGSWCCILMSTTPITEKDFIRANKTQVKMIGKIESVRLTTQQVEDQRQTVYAIVGVDWGHVFHNKVYIDSLIMNQGDPNSMGSFGNLALRAMIQDASGALIRMPVIDLLRTIISVAGAKMPGETHNVEQGIGRLDKSMYDFLMPADMIKFFEFRGPSTRGDFSSDPNVRSLSLNSSAGNFMDGGFSPSQKLNELLDIRTGVLRSPGTYTYINDAEGWLDTTAFQGWNSFWDIMTECSNPALNEMFCEMRWDMGDDCNGLSMTLYNRIKPFSYKNYNLSASPSIMGTPNASYEERAADAAQYDPAALRSMFQYLPYHFIPSDAVFNLDMGTNWRDKFNFIELKPSFQSTPLLDAFLLIRTQQFDEVAFQREGFRPMMVTTKLFPANPEINSQPDSVDAGIDYKSLVRWPPLLREWYFDTHRLLNGTITMVGAVEYIPVGDNIKFETSLMGPTFNLNSAIAKSRQSEYILAHVEGITHAFSVSSDGARTYTTVIQFVRGIIVDACNQIVGEGALDQISTDIPIEADDNDVNTIGTSDLDDPDLLRKPPTKGSK